MEAWAAGAWAWVVGMVIAGATVVSSGVLPLGVVLSLGVVSLVAMCLVVAMSGPVVLVALAAC